MPELQENPQIQEISHKSEEKTPPESSISHDVGIYRWNGIPIETIRHFGMDASTMSEVSIQQLKEIDAWSKIGDKDTIENRLNRIRSLESRLGSPGLRETRISKAWNWVKMAKHISQLR